MHTSHLALSFSLCVAPLAFAAEQDNFYDSPRSLGRGGTFAAQRDSDEASRLNPATLAESGIKFQLRFLEASLFIGENTIATINDLSSAASSNDGFEVLRKFDTKFGERQYFKLEGSLFSMRIGSFEIFPFAASTAWLELSSPPLPKLSWLSDSMAGVGAAYALELGKDFALGITMRSLQRWYIAGDIDFVDVVDMTGGNDTKFEDYTPLRTGSGLAADLGLIWKPLETLRLGLTVHDLGDTKTGEDIPHIKQRISLGAMHRLKLRLVDIDSFFDIQGLDNRRGLNILRLLHFGTEIGRSLFSRDHDYGFTAGYNEGYFSAGLFADLFFFRLDVSNYAVELGETPGQRSDRRWAATLRSTMTF